MVNTVPSFSSSSCPVPSFSLYGKGQSEWGTNMFLLSSICMLCAPVSKRSRQCNKRWLLMTWRAGDSWVTTLLWPDDVEERRRDQRQECLEQGAASFPKKGDLDGIHHSTPHYWTQRTVSHNPFQFSSPSSQHSVTLTQSVNCSCPFLGVSGVWVPFRNYISCSLLSVIVDQFSFPFSLSPSLVKHESKSICENGWRIKDEETRDGENEYFPSLSATFLLLQRSNLSEFEPRKVPLLRITIGWRDDWWLFFPSFTPSYSYTEWRHLHPLLFSSFSRSLSHLAHSQSQTLLTPNVTWCSKIVSVGHTVSRWLPTITNYTLIARLCLQLVISPSLLCTWSGGMRKEWMWLKWMDGERRRRITANACDAMCWSIMLSSFHRRFERRKGREEGENPKNIPASNTPVKVCFFCPTKMMNDWLWLEANSHQNVSFSLPTSEWTLAVTDPSSLHSFSPFYSFFIPSLLFPFVPSSQSFHVGAIQLFLLMGKKMKKREDEMWACLSLWICEMHEGRRLKEEMNNESTALMTDEHVFVFSGAFHSIF